MSIKSFIRKLARKTYKLGPNTIRGEFQSTHGYSNVYISTQLVEAALTDPKAAQIIVLDLYSALKDAKPIPYLAKGSHVQRGGDRLYSYENGRMTELPLDEKDSDSE